MYEPYLNREKQYMKMNAVLDNRFKEIDQMKSDRSDVVKPRLNVFGNGSKVQSVKATIPVSKPKRNEIKCGTTPKSSGDVLILNENALSRTESSITPTSTSKVMDKPKKSQLTSSQENDFLSKGKLSNSIDGDSPAVIIQTQSQVTLIPTNNNVTVSSTTNEPTSKKNISADGLIK